MTVATYVEVMAADPATGAAAPVRLAGGGDQAYALFGHLDWLAGVAATPRFVAEYGFADGGWTGGAIPQTAPIVFQPADPATLSRLGTRYWRDAPVRIWTQDGDAAPVLELVGTVAADAWTTGGLTLTVSDLGGALAKPFVTARFTGKGGIEGDADVAGREKRRSFGRVYGVEARLLLKAHNIYEVGDPGRPLQSIAVVRDKGRAWPVVVVAWAGSIAATLDALIAGIPPGGGALVAPSIGCVRWWTQPAGPLVVDLLGEIGDGYVESAPAIAARIVAESSALVLRDLGDAIALRPAPAGLHVASTSETPAQLLDRLLLGVSLLWSVEADGGVRVRPWTFGVAVPQPWSAGAAPIAWDAGAAAAPWTPAPRIERIRSHGAQRLRTFRPTRSRRIGYRRNHRIHDTGDIAADILASDVAYADGTPIDALKPSEPGAQVTRGIDASVSTVAIRVDDAGVPVPGQLPATVRFTVTSGAADASLRADWSVTTTGGVMATIDDAEGSMTRGVVTIAGVTGSGQVLAVALLDGVVLSKTVSVTTKGALADKGTAGTGDIAAGAVSRTAFASTSADVACPRDQATTVIAFTFTKVDAGSVLDFLMYAHCYNGDDLDFTGNLYLDGQLLQPFPIRMPFDNANSRGQTTVTPMALVPGIPAGEHTVSFALTSHETEGPTIVRAGAFLKVTELRAPAIAAAQAGNGGGSTGGGSGGGSGGGGGDVPQQVE